VTIWRVLNTDTSLRGVGRLCGHRANPRNRRRHAVGGNKEGASGPGFRNALSFRGFSCSVSAAGASDRYIKTRKRYSRIPLGLYRWTLLVFQIR
jgi:hypothetical protein